MPCVVITSRSLFFFFFPLPFLMPY